MKQIVALLLALFPLNVTAMAQTRALASAQPAEAWVRFNGQGVTASGAGGLANRETGRTATIDDPVRVASVSKLVATLGVMRLVEQGKLDLNRDVSDYLGWTLRNPAYPKQKITLAMLLSHTSSLDDNGEGYLVPLGVRVEEAMRNPKMWDREHKPGSFFHYANINFPVVGGIIERVTGERFDRAMDRLVMKPLGLKACFNWGGGCTDADAARAVILYRPNGEIARDDLKGRLPACPVFVREGAGCDLSANTLGSNGALFSPQGGLRISAKELAGIGQMLANGGGAPDGSAFLKARSLHEMRKVRWRYNGRNGVTESGFYCNYGLATQILGVSHHEDCRDRLPGMTGLWYGHAGDAYALKSGLWVEAKTGNGIAYYTTAVADETPRGGPSAFTAAEQRMAGKR